MMDYFEIDEGNLVLVIRWGDTLEEKKPWHAFITLPSEFDRSFA